MSAHSMTKASLRDLKTELLERLRVRAQELEDMIVSYLRSGSLDSVDRAEEDPQFTIGQREAVATCLECWLLAVAQGGPWSGPVPPAVDVQARRAVRSDVSLATALSRYVGAQALVWDLVLEEAQNIPCGEARLSSCVRRGRLQRLCCRLSCAQCVRRIRLSPRTTSGAVSSARVSSCGDCSRASLASMCAVLTMTSTASISD